MRVSQPVAPTVEARRVPGPLAPADLVEMTDSEFPGWLRIAARDPAGTTRMTLYLETSDGESVDWIVKVLRHWLAWRHKAIALRLLRRHG